MSHDIKYLSLAADYNTLDSWSEIQQKDVKLTCDILQASDRKLAVIRKQSTPVELLMESIRNEKTRNSLRKTSGPPPRPALGKIMMMNSRLSRQKLRMISVNCSVNLENCFYPRWLHGYKSPVDVM